MLVSVFYAIFMCQDIAAATTQSDRSMSDANIYLAREIPTGYINLAKHAS